jgi:glycerol-3-phosphate dehydrogenase
MSANELSSRSRSSVLARLERESFDVLVIGGGITGVGIARDAALRGLKVALVERRDFASGTSSRSSKLIHGGVRYLQQGDVGLVMEAANERRILRRLAPHLATPIPMLVPVYSRGGYAKLKVGLWTFDRMARVGEGEQYQMLDREQTIAAEPLLRTEALYGAGTYFENLTDDARLVLATAKHAAALGAAMVNYLPVTRLLLESGAVIGAEVTDAFQQQTIAVHARVVVNAAGPWVDSVREMLGTETARLHLTKGIHLVLPRERLPVSRIVVMQARDRRSAFVVPRDGMVYLGTTDTDYEGPFDDPQITEEDAGYLLDAAGRTFDVPPITLDEVTGAWAGLRPLLHEEGKSPSEISRKDEIMVSATGLISIAGGKLTTFRRMAERTSDMVCARLKELGSGPFKSLGNSDNTPLSGGETGEDVASFAARLKSKWPSTADLVDRLVRLYGTEAQQIVEGIVGDPAMGERMAPNSPLTRAEVEHAVRCEVAATVEDVLERRTRLFLFARDNGLPEAPCVARTMGRMLDWSEARMQQEVAQYVAHVQHVKGFTGPAAQEGQAAHA